MSGDLTGANTLMQTIPDPRRRQDVEALIRKVAQDKKENG